MILEKKHFLLLFTFLLSVSFGTFSQGNKEIDSLTRQLERKDLPDSVQMELLSGLAYAYQTISPAKSFEYIEDGIDIAQRQNNQKYIAEFLAHMGSANWYIGDYPNALYNTLQSLKINEKIGNNKGIARNLNSLGTIYDTQGELEKALSYYEQSIQLDISRNDSSKLPSTFNNIGVIYQKKNQLKKSLEFFFQALAIADRQNNKLMIGVCLNSIGDTYYLDKNYSSAIAMQKRALALEEQTQDNEGIAYSYNALAKAYSAISQFDSAEYCAIKALGVAQKYQFKPQIKDILLSLKDINFARGNYKKALLYADSVIVMTENLFGENKNKIISQLQQKYELDKKETQIASLQKDNRIQEIEIENQSLWRNIWIGSLSVALLFLFGLFSLYRQRDTTNRQLNENNRQLNEKNQALFKLNATKDKLFSIISHDLRSPFNTLKATLELMKDNAFSPTEIEKVSSQLHQNVENISYTLDNLLQWSISQMKGAQTNIENVKLDEIIIETTNFYKEVASQKDIELVMVGNANIYVKADKNQLRLIMRNLVNNAIKFTFPKGKVMISAQASSISKNNEAEISISDTGVGMSELQLRNLFFPASQSTNGTSGEKGTGLGLLLSKEFIENNDGKINVQSKLYAGSTFTFTLKIAQ